MWLLEKIISFFIPRKTKAQQLKNILELKKIKNDYFKIENKTVKKLNKYSGKKRYVKC